MEMSEVTEVFEITDSSINVDNIAEKTAIESSKRRYSPDLDESEELTSKKFKEEESKIESETDGNDVTESIDATKDEGEIKDSSQEEVIEDQNETSILDKTTESESMLEEIVSDGDDKNNDDDDIVEDNGQVLESEDSEIEEEVEDEEEEESEGHTSDEESDDDALMMRAMNASNTAKGSSLVNDEPIALDSDSEVSEGDENDEVDDGEEEDESRVYETTNFDRNNSFPYCFKTRMLKFSPRFYLARKLVKKSIKIINAKLAEKKKIEKPSNEQEKVDIDENVVEPEIISESNTVETKPIEIPQETVEQELPKEQKEEPSKVDEPMQVDESHPKLEDKSTEVPPKEVQEVKSTSEQKTNEKVKIDTKIQQNSSNPSDESSQAQAATTDQEMDETSFLLTEILKNSIDDIMNRYVFNNTESNQQNSVPVAMEDFAEKLFMCLQQNKHDIQKAQQIWNEKLHIKYKIREMMERIRRHRAVVDIESFGYKPTHDNPIISSKSSTTASENDHFDKASRMSTESVSRLIQDVRANVLKREEQKQRIENHMNVNDSAYDENNPFSQLQNSSNQGRQGQIIDVQSIINDFRQKNPQEIPRRGRRFKNSFGSQGLESPYNRMDINARNESYKSNNSQGFPEVSLLPVNSFYKNLPQTSGNSSFGQKSSLLQSILTKSTKSPIAVQQMNNNSSGTSSTLARLLTAPERERTLQNMTPRQMGSSSRQSNGEITITPIQPGTSRKQDFSMDDDETSTDGHLVIDESEFDMSDRKSDLLLCQGCRRHKALFMCAGCSKQWYCSKECQELAWDDHAESCMV